MPASHKSRCGKGIRVVGPSKPVGVGRATVKTEAIDIKETRNGDIRVMLCRITSPGNDHGRTVEYVLPWKIETDTEFWDFVVSAIGKPPEIGDVVDFNELIGMEAVVQIEHKRHGSGARARVYSNVVSISPMPKGARRR